MRQKKSSVVAIIAILLIIAGLIGIAATMTYVPQPPSYSGPDSEAAPFEWPIEGGTDAMFIEEMIPHHDDAIAMAELALIHAEHPEIKQLAESIKETQTAENAQMRKWYRAWFDASVPTTNGSAGMMGGMMGGTMDMAALEAAEPFDKAFIEQMIPHHRIGIMMSQMASRSSVHPELRDLARSIIDAQSAEITQMQTWYEEWYGR